MRSKEQNDEWLNSIQSTYDHLDAPQELAPRVSWELAERIWEAENANIEVYKARMFGNIQDAERLREYLEFDLMDSSLWSTFAALVFSLLERDDITNLDFVIGRITNFVQMCPHFYHLRFGPQQLLGAKRPDNEAGSNLSDARADS